MSDLSSTPINSQPAPAASNTPTPDLAQLKQTCDALEAQTHTLRLILFFALVGMALFFWREAGYHAAIAAQQQPQVMQISQLVAQLEKQNSSLEKQGQALQNAILRLAEYAKTHPDYAQILAKYGLVVNSTAAAPAGAAPKKP